MYGIVQIRHVAFGSGVTWLSFGAQCSSLSDGGEAAGCHWRLQQLQTFARERTFPRKPMLISILVTLCNPLINDHNPCPPPVVAPLRDVSASITIHLQRCIDAYQYRD
jgi:hypothetical protein